MLGLGSKLGSAWGQGYGQDSQNLLLLHNLAGSEVDGLHFFEREHARNMQHLGLNVIIRSRRLHNNNWGER